MFFLRMENYMISKKINKDEFKESAEWKDTKLKNEVIWFCEEIVQPNLNESGHINFYTNFKKIF